MENNFIFWLLICYGIVLMAAAMYYFQVFRRIKEYYWEKKKPETSYYATFHHDTGISERIMINTEKKSFKYREGTYLIEKEALRHGKKPGAFGGIEPIPSIHYIYGNPSPIIYLNQTVMKKDKSKFYELDAKGLTQVESNSFIRQLLSAAMQENIMKLLLTLAVVNIIVTVFVIALWFGIIEHPVLCVLHTGG